MGRPLVVDVDEVLLRSQLLTEAAFAELAHRPQSLFSFLAALLSGQRVLNRRIAQTARFNPSRLLYDNDMVALLLQTLGEGRPVYLSSERYDETLLRPVAEHLGVFTAWSASQETPEAKLANLPRSSDGFDYIGCETAGLPGAASRAARPTTRSAPSNADARTWAKLLRVHQYAKNALVLVPLLTAHQFALQPAMKALLAAAAFSLCASGAYIFNDLADVTADRSHPSKRHRPIANGAISPAQALIAMVLLLAAAFAIAIPVSPAFAGSLLGYLALTAAYSFRLKQIMLVDVVTLAILYTIRVIAGAVAIDVVMSEWLFAFSLFIFMSLALVKRYVELAGQPGSDRLAKRDYHANDQSMVGILAAASGFNAVVIFTLYISSETVRALYAHPQVLWIACPILMYWIGRVMLLAHRGLIDDDPVIFALRDRVSWLALGAIGAIMLAAL